MLRKFKNFLLSKKSSIIELIKRLSTGTIFSIIFWAIFFSLPNIYFSILLIIILLYILIFEWKNILNPKKLTFWLLMPIYPILPFIFMIIMMHNPHYQSLLLLMYIIVFTFDTAAFITGKLIGKHKLTPRISPKKTWEGFIGGTLGASVSLYLTLIGLEINKPLYIILLFAAILSTISALGDLFESWLKRKAKVKDSGNLLPGHGGFLDRFDGILFTAVFIFIFKDYLVKLFGF